MLGTARKLAAEICGVERNRFAERNCLCEAVSAFAAGQTDSSGARHEAGQPKRESVMSALREAVLLQMRLRGFAAATVESYIHALEQLWAFFKQPLERLTCAEVQRFLDEIITVRKLAWATVQGRRI